MKSVYLYVGLKVRNFQNSKIHINTFLHSTKGILKARRIR